MSKMDDILKKLDGVLSEDDVKSFGSEIKSLIEEKASIKIQAEKASIEKLAEEYCDIKIQEGVKKVAEKLISEYDAKVDDLEATLVEKLDKFLDLEITSKISDDMLKQIAVNETYAPIIDGIQKLFEHQHVELDSEGYGSLRKYQEEISELKDQLAESIADKIELEESVDTAASKLLISSKTEHLTESEKSKVFSFFEGKQLAETKDLIDSFVELVVEKDESSFKQSIQESSQESGSDTISENAGVMSDEEYVTEGHDEINLKEKDKEIDEVVSGQSDIYDLASRFI